MHTTAQTRRTSAYTLRFPTAEQAQAAAAALAVPVNDTGDLSVSWRATGDLSAISTAEAALAMVGLASAPGVVLTTGLGIHRRTVAEN